MDPYRDTIDTTSLKILASKRQQHRAFVFEGYGVLGQLQKKGWTIYGHNKEGFFYFSNNNHGIWCKVLVIRDIEKDIHLY